MEPFWRFGKNDPEEDEPVCYVVGAGVFGDDTPAPGERELLIAADGGWEACRSRSLRVDLLIGDFDSLGRPPEKEKAGKAEILRLPVEKDDTDMRAAVREGWRRGYRRFVLYGGTGGRRASHTLANIQLLAEIAEKGGQGKMVGEGARFYVIRNGAYRFSGEAEGDLSVFSLSDAAEGVCISGTKYVLQNAALTNRFPLGVSNSYIGRAGEISVEKGSLLILEEQRAPE